MKKVSLISAAALCVLLVQAAFSQNKSDRVVFGAICNGLALHLPKPEVPQNVSSTNGGVVTVQILIDEKGNVEKTQAVSGHPLLRPSAEKAARQARFRKPPSATSVKLSCFLVYNFAYYNPNKPEEKSRKEIYPTINLGVLNEQAEVLPMPRSPAVQPRGDGKVEVKVKIDLQSGEVVSAMAAEGHPLFRAAAAKAALQAKFPPIPTEFSNVFGSGFLIYKPEDFNGKTVENKTPKKFLIIEKGVVNSRAKSLPKPYYSPDIKAAGIVEVKVLIDVLSGNVVLAKAVSGHPLLKVFAEDAARKAEFSPAFINTAEPVYVKAVLLYKFNSDHTVETNLTDKDLK